LKIGDGNMKASRIYERQIAQIYRERGYKVEDYNEKSPNHPGCDIKIQKLDPLSLKPVGRAEYIECKSGRYAEKASLSPRQKETQGEYGDRYIVKRNKFYRDDRL
jgi:hypothetical protein